MGVFSGFAERGLPLGEISKLFQESRLGKWESSQVLPEEYFATLREFSKLCQESRICECESAQVLPKEYCHWAILRLLKTGEQHRRMGVFRKNIGMMGEFSKLFRESRRGEWEFSQVLTKEYCHCATSQNWRAA